MKNYILALTLTIASAAPTYVLAGSLSHEIQEISSNSEDNFGLLYLEALLVIREGNWEVALEQLDSLSQMRGNYPADFNYNYGKVLAKNGYFVRAFERLEQYLNDHGNTGRYYTETVALYEAIDKKRNVIFKSERKFSDGSVYSGDFLEGAIHGRGIMTWANGDKYEGTFENNSRTGIGTYTWANGDKYVGEFLNNQRTGKGVFTWKDGTKYDGSFNSDQMTGEGTLTNSSGDKYHGSWIDGQRNGKGIQTFSNGDRLDGTWEKDLYLSGFYDRFDSKSLENGAVYKGQMRNEKRHGPGTITYPDGTTIKAEWNNDFPKNAWAVIRWANGKSYEGNFVDGTIQGNGTFYENTSSYYIATFTKTSVQDSNLVPKITGRGVHVNSNGRYEGDLTAGVRTGKGTFTGSNGSKYEGYFKNGIFHGKGTLIYANKAKYTGDWIDGYRHGKGDLFYADGSVYSGDWHQGAQTGYGKITYSKNNTNLSTYEGSFLNDRFQGNGTLRYRDGTIYTGSFENGKFEGKGQMKWSNGDSYTGDYSKGYRHGKGIYYFHSGGHYRGNWKDGVKHGYGWMIVSDGQKVKGYWLNDVIDKECSFCIKDPMKD
jgi:hypothetical protein